jgi:two-component system NtrC family sensor kinase
LRRARRGRGTPPGGGLPHFIAILAVLLITAAIGWYLAWRKWQDAIAEAQQASVVARQRENERDLAQKVLAQRVEEERSLAREKTEFLAKLADYEKYAALAQLALGAAHEINNPLLGLFSHLELELKTATSEEQRAEIEQCLAGAKRISSTVRGLLNYARPGPLKLARLSLDRLVTDTLGFLWHQPLFHNIKLEKNVSPDLPPISADSNQLSQVLVNLLLNAAQAMPQGGTISITAEKVKFSEEVEIRVSDTGCGIAADILPRVFEPFFTTKRGKGTGLGLSISQAYVRNHGGDMAIESVPQRGTTVKIVLPIRHVAQPTDEELHEVVT